METLVPVGEDGRREDEGGGDEGAEGGDPVDAGACVDVIGVGDERDRNGDGEDEKCCAQDLTLAMPSVVMLFGGGNCRLRAVGITVVEQQCSASELACVGFASPGHCDHEGDGENPCGHPDRRSDQEPDGGLQPVVG